MPTLSTSSRVIAVLCALFWSVPAIAQPQMSIPGETTVSFKKARYVRGIEKRKLEPYRQRSITHITFHHEGFAGGKRKNFEARRKSRAKQSTAQRVLNVHNFHADSGFGMIAYNYVIGTDGTVAKGRPVSYAPATFTRDPKTGKRADFRGHVAVMALGDFDFEPLGKAQKLGLLKAMSHAQRQFRVPTSRIQPHRDHVAHNGVYGTACPGSFMLSIQNELAQSTLTYSLQDELVRRGCHDGTVDGEFGHSTQASLDRLTKANPNLALSGASDETLWSLLDAPNAKCIR